MKGLSPDKNELKPKLVAQLPSNVILSDRDRHENNQNYKSNLSTILHNEGKGKAKKYEINIGE